MSKCNLLKPLNSNNGNFFMFSQYGEDLTKEYTQKDHYRVVPSKFIAMNLDAQNFDNNTFAQYFQNYYENACSFFRRENDWSQETALDLLIQALAQGGMINEYSIKHIGDINIYSNQEIDGTSYNEIYCYIGNDVIDKKYAITKVNDKFYAHSSQCIIGYDNEFASIGSTSYINGLNLVPIYDSGEQGTGYVKSQYSIDWDGEDYTDKSASFDINSMIVLYDIEKVENGERVILHSNIPMGLYVTGKINGGIIENGIRKYVHNAEIYDQGTSYGLRICTRYLSYPNAVVFQDTIAVESDETQENLTSVLSRINDSQVLMREALNKVVENSTNLKDHYNQFKGNLVNVPYIRTVAGESYWFVNGKNTEVKVLPDNIELNVSEISSSDIYGVFKVNQGVVGNDDSIVIEDEVITSLFNK